MRRYSSTERIRWIISFLATVVIVGFLYFSIIGIIEGWEKETKPAAEPIYESDYRIGPTFFKPSKLPPDVEIIEGDSIYKVEVVRSSSKDYIEVYLVDYGTTHSLTATCYRDNEKVLEYEIETLTIKYGGLKEK